MAFKMLAKPFRINYFYHLNVLEWVQQFSECKSAAATFITHCFAPYFIRGKPTIEMFATDQVSSLQSPYNPASIFLSSIAVD